MKIPDRCTANSQASCFTKYSYISPMSSQTRHGFFPLILHVVNFEISGVNPLRRRVDFKTSSSHQLWKSTDLLGHGSWLSGLHGRGMHRGIASASRFRPDLADAIFLSVLKPKQVHPIFQFFLHRLSFPSYHILKVISSTSSCFLRMFELVVSPVICASVASSPTDPKISVSSAIIQLASRALRNLLDRSLRTLLTYSRCWPSTRLYGASFLLVLAEDAQELPFSSIDFSRGTR